MAEIKSQLSFYPHRSCSRKNEYIRVIRAEATAAVVFEDEQRFNFGRSAKYPWPRPRAKKKLQNRHSLRIFMPFSRRYRRHLKINSFLELILADVIVVSKTTKPSISKCSVGGF